MIKYKALMLDLDNTTIPNRLDGMPSERVSQAVKKALSHLHVGVVTSRPYFSAKPIIKSLGLHGPSVLSGGAQVINATTDEILWQKTIAPTSLKEIYEITKKYNFYVSNGGEEFLYKGEEKTDGLQAYINDVDQEVADEVVKQAAHISDIVIHTTKSWVEGKVAMLFNPVQATKQYGIYEVAKILNIDPSEIIGVGDGGNDFPLLMACGLKIAMGNADPALKEIADYVAPSVDDDGVAHVIEKFILQR